MVAYSFKKRFVLPITVGLSATAAETFGCPPKRQTIRAIGKRRHARPGDLLQLYCGMRTKHCKLIGKAICSSVSPITIWIWPVSGMDIQLGRRLLRGQERQAFARSDGFEDTLDMRAFWRTEHPDVEKFEGVMISWEPLISVPATELEKSIMKRIQHEAER